MKLYTRTGDQGYTKLVGANVSKDHIRVEAYGTIDEINSFIGLAIAQLKIETTANIIIEELEEIQHELFDTGADLANVTPTYVCKINQKMVEKLEKKIDVYSKEAPELHNFILPGGSSSASTIHI